MARLSFALPLVAFIALRSLALGVSDAPAAPSPTAAVATPNVTHAPDVARTPDVTRIPDIASTSDLSPACSEPLQDASCGDGRCSPPEDCNTCPQDCGRCCGDYHCAPPEDCHSCPEDCGPC
jgi:hypothetical protein